jgi:hypothetical protein
MSRIVTDGGSCAWIVGIRSRTDFATSTALDPAWRNTAITAIADGTCDPSPKTAC